RCREAAPTARRRQIAVVLVSAAAGLVMASSHRWRPSEVPRPARGWAPPWSPLEWRAGQIPLAPRFWAVTGGAFGIAAGSALGVAGASLLPGAPVVSHGLPALLGGYLGTKILDTSVIVDGRITDVCETGVVEGTLVVPQFVKEALSR